MRQTGFLAASAAFALTHNFPKLMTVHQLAKRLERGLLEIGVEITVSAETCMVSLVTIAGKRFGRCGSTLNKVFFDPSSIGSNYTEVAERAESLPQPLSLAGSRLVLHIQTAEQAVDDLLDMFRDLAQEKVAAGFVKRAAKAEDRLYKHKDKYLRRK